VLCSILSSTALSCKTPEVFVKPNVLDDFLSYQKDFSVHLYIHLGAGSDVLDNRNTTFRMPFEVHANPTIHEWESLQGFKIYDDETHIRIMVR